MIWKSRWNSLLLEFQEKMSMLKSVFLRSESGHEFKLFSAIIKPGPWLADQTSLPIISLVFGGKLLELISWFRISDKTAFNIERGTTYSITIDVTYKTLSQIYFYFPFYKNITHLVYNNY